MLFHPFLDFLLGRLLSLVEDNVSARLLFITADGRVSKY
jgi:hypothetical protein